MFLRLTPADAAAHVVAAAHTGGHAFLVEFPPEFAADRFSQQPLQPRHESTPEHAAYDSAVEIGGDGNATRDLRHHAVDEDYHESSIEK